MRVKIEDLARDDKVWYFTPPWVPPHGSYPEQGFIAFVNSGLDGNIRLKHSQAKYFRHQVGKSEEELLGNMLRNSINHL